MNFWDFLCSIFGRKPPIGYGPHDQRADETIDKKTGVGEADGQLLDNTAIDPKTQDKAKGFSEYKKPYPDDHDDPTDAYGDVL